MSVDSAHPYEWQSHHILLTYKGRISVNNANKLIQKLEWKSLQLKESLKTRKRLFSVFVECIQNVLHHSIKPSANQNSNPTVLVFSRGDSYVIETTNMICNQKLPVLKKKVREISSMTREELRKEHRMILTRAPLTCKITAGLGLIEVASKSRKLSFNIKNLNDRYSLFQVRAELETNPS